MNYKSAGKWGDISLIAAVALSLSLYLFEETGVVFWMMAALVFVLIAAGIFIKLRYYRCPRCGALLPMRTLIEPKFCPACGDALGSSIREDDKYLQ
jgi:ribosomal protein S27AE